MAEQIESSLTAPEDRNKVEKWIPQQSIPPLTNEQTKEAFTELNNTDFVSKFPRVDRTYADPPPPMQRYGLFSFIPAKGATPNENGVFGYAKQRGNYESEIEANQRSEFLIRNVDSYHQIFHTYVGRPFPLTVSSRYSAEVKEIDIRKDMAESISSHVKSKKQEEQETMREIKDREEALLQESRDAQKGKSAFDDPYETYITMRVKKAQLLWTYAEHKKKMEEIIKVLVDTVHIIDELDKKDETFKDKYFEKYRKAREVAGIKETDKDMQQNFMKFLVEDLDLPELTEALKQNASSSSSSS
jgi:hypothetical protein